MGSSCQPHRDPPPCPTPAQEGAGRGGFGAAALSVQWRSGDVPPGQSPQPQGPPLVPACPSPVDLGEHLLLDAGLLLVRGVPASPRVLREVVPDEMQLEGGQSWHCPARQTPASLLEAPPSLGAPPARCRGPGQLYLLLPAGVVLQGSLEEGPGIVGVIVNPLTEVVADVEAPGGRGG